VPQPVEMVPKPVEKVLKRVEKVPKLVEKVLRRTKTTLMVLELLMLKTVLPQRLSKNLRNLQPHPRKLTHILERLGLRTAECAPMTKWSDSLPVHRPTSLPKSVPGPSMEVSLLESSSLPSLFYWASYTTPQSCVPSWAQSLSRTGATCTTDLTGIR